MSKLKFMYCEDEEKNKLIRMLQTEYKIVKISKEYKEGPHRRIYVDLKNK